ncbi:MAG: heme ABC exporter ATP-binding protein CcmA [Pseudomonadota bacterium]
MPQGHLPKGEAKRPQSAYQSSGLSPTPPPTGEPATYGVYLTVKGLSAGRGGGRAFAGVDLAMAPGEAVILRGANGAGKTTLLRAIAGLTPPTEGAADLSDKDGAPLSPADTAAFAGHLDGLKPTLTARDNARFWARLYGRADADKAISAAFSALDIERLTDRPSGALSAGQRRRLGLCRVLIADRPLWLLDEPTASMDAASAKTVVGLIEAHSAKGGSALIATHDAINIKGARTVTMGATSMGAPA